MKLILFGAGRKGGKALSYFGKENVAYFCDNKVESDGEGELFGVKILSFKRFVEIHREYVVIVCVGGTFTPEICAQLDDVRIEDYFVYDNLIKTNMLGKGLDVFMQELQNEGTRVRLFRDYYKYLLGKANGQLDFLKAHADITALKPATGNLRKRQLALVDYATVFFDYIAELEITPFLAFGNLIGAVRHQGFIPWDDDLDFGIMRSDYEKLMQFAEERCIIGSLCGDGCVEIAGSRLNANEIHRAYPDQYIFIERSEMMQVGKGTSEKDCMGMDFWVYDFYKDEYDIADHMKYLESITHKRHEIKQEEDVTAFLKEEIEKNPMISRTATNHIFPGIDNQGGYTNLKVSDRWIPAEEIFPLERVKFEHTEFWAPRDMEAVLSYEYANIMEFPPDVGYMPHFGE